MSNGSNTLAQQIADLQAQILQLQQDMPGGPFQAELARLQNDLAQLQANPPPPTPRQLTIVQPTPPPIGLTGATMAVWQTFSAYHQALLKYAGGGRLMSRQDWLHLVDVAADMTTAIYGSGEYPLAATFNPPTVPGLYGWNGATQSWNLTVVPPTQQSGILAYNAATGLWVPVPTNGGGGGGSNTLPQPPATGGPYAWDSNSASWVQIVNMAPPISIPNGGTAATTAPQALANLGAMPIVGVTNGSNAVPGNVGEAMEVASPNVSTPLFIFAGTPVYTSILSITLSAGDWDLSGDVVWQLNSGPYTDNVVAQAGIGLTVSQPPIGWGAYTTLTPQWVTGSASLPTHRISNTATATYYLTVWITAFNAADVAFGATSAGFLHARRMR